MILISSLEDEISPQVLFLIEPLNQMNQENVRWLKPLVHLLWLSRYPINKWTAQVINKLEEADRLFYDIEHELLNRNYSVLRKRLKTFIDICKDLSKGISEYPHGILPI